MFFATNFPPGWLSECHAPIESMKVTRYLYVGCQEVHGSNAGVVPRGGSCTLGIHEMDTPRPPISGLVFYEADGGRGHCVAVGIEHTCRIILQTIR